MVDGGDSVQLDRLRGLLAKELDDVPVDPAEADDLRLHVRNCILRHVIQVRLIREGMMRRQKSETIAWCYRVIVIPALLFIIYQLWALGPAINKLIALGPASVP